MSIELHPRIDYEEFQRLVQEQEEDETRRVYEYSVCLSYISLCIRGRYVRVQSLKYRSYLLFTGPFRRRIIPCQLRRGPSLGAQREDSIRRCEGFTGKRKRTLMGNFHWGMNCYSDHCIHPKELSNNVKYYISKYRYRLQGDNSGRKKPPLTCGKLH